MNLEFRSSFSRDLRRIRDSEVRDRVLRVIEELEATPNITETLRATRIKSDKGRYYFGLLISKPRTAVYTLSQPYRGTWLASRTGNSL